MKELHVKGNLKEKMNKAGDKAQYESEISNQFIALENIVDINGV
jgi:hypothetical protein